MVESASSSSTADAMNQPPHQPLNAMSPPIAPPSNTNTHTIGVSIIIYSLLYPHFMSLGC
eukprot:7005860-Ditylum_brightwellii.AAC.1